MDYREQNALLDKALNFGVEKCLRDGRQLKSFPHVTQNGEWLMSEHGRWTAGFFVGMLWIASLLRRDSSVSELAMAWARRLEPRTKDTSTHDMGFLFEPSYVRGFNITHSGELRNGAIQAARSLATRFHPKGHFIPAWSPEEDPSYAGLAIVDTIMNLPLVFWAGRQTNDQSLWSIGELVATTVKNHHVRSDGSTYHTVYYDPITGEMMARGTHQGAHDESCWTRGQAWSIYGFTKVGKLLDSDEMIAMAYKTAEYFLARLGDRCLPPWDFDRDMDGEPRDSAAGSIATAGLLELGHVTGDHGFTEAARRMAVGLVESCVDFDHPETPGLLKHGTVDAPRNSGIDESIIYGDHYFMETLLKLRHPEFWGELGC